MDGGQIIFKFKGDTNDVDKKVSGLSEKFKSVGGAIGKSVVNGTLIATTALTGMVAKSVSAAGELEQQIGGTEAVFGDFAKTVQESSTKAFQTAGISANDYMSYANKIGSLMKGAGIDTEQAMNLSSQAMQRASDVASIMGIDVNSAMEAITGAAKGNFTMMDNLGVAMNATNLEAYALSQGITKSYNEMSQAEKVGLAYQMFLDKTSDYAGNYAKENETFAGSFNTLKAAMQNFISGSGSIDEVIDSLTSFGDILVNSISEMAPKVVEGIIKLVNSIASKLPDLLNKLLPVVIDGAVQLISGLTQSLPTLIPTLLNGIVQAFTLLLPLLPQILQTLLQGAIFIIQALAEQMPVLIPQIIDAILQMIPILIDNLPLFISAGFQLLIGIASGLIKAIPTLLSHIPSIISSIIGYFKKMPSEMIKIGGNLIKGLWNGISNLGDWVIKKIGGLGNSILKGIKGIFGIHSPSREFAWIGKMNMVGLVEGTEDMEDKVYSAYDDMLSFGNFDTMFDLSPNLYGNGALNMSSNPNITVVNNMETDPLGQMVNTVKTFSGGAKNDYNYGVGV